MVNSKYTPGGPRDDAEPTDGLPTIMAGRDPEPTSCPRCGSRMLGKSLPVGRDRFGQIWCDSCSRTICWVLPPLRLARHRALGAPPTFDVQLASGVKPARAPIYAASFEQREGCAQTCTRTYGHDPAVHEAHGRAMLWAEISARPSGVIATGPLVVDFDTARVLVDDFEVRITGFERKILEYLASRLDQVCRYWEIAATIWDTLTADLEAAEEAPWHTLRVYTGRLRSRLGAGGGLIETVPTVGLRLRAERYC